MALVSLVPFGSNSLGTAKHPGVSHFRFPWGLMVGNRKRIHIATAAAKVLSGWPLKHVEKQRGLANRMPENMVVGENWTGS